MTDNQITSLDEIDKSQTLMKKPSRMIVCVAVLQKRVATYDPVAGSRLELARGDVLMHNERSVGTSKRAVP